MSEKRLHILADENMPALPACFGSAATLKVKAGRRIVHSDLKNCDALFVRSITAVNAELLSGASINFVGSATIGTDHIDQEYLACRGIAFAHAPGSNAQSVVEYVITAIAVWCQKRGKSQKNLKFGIIGKGQIGSRLFDFLNNLGVSVMCCDPPLKQAGVDGPWHEMSDIQQCDVITCHVPLIDQGVHTTRHLIDDCFMSGMKPGSLLINSSRGSVVDNVALLYHLKHNHFEAVLDVWETEPAIDLRLMDLVFLATPHIAGYAYEAKIRGTFMLYQAFCHHFHIKPNVKFEDLLTSNQSLVCFKSIQEWTAQANNYYDILSDDSMMRTALNKSLQSFDKLRKNYPKRHEFLQL